MSTWEYDTYRCPECGASKGQKTRGHWPDCSQLTAEDDARISDAEDTEVYDVRD